MPELPEFNSDDEMIAWLDKNGALFWEGVSEDGEPMFRFDLDVLKEIFPPLYKEIMSEIDEDLMTLYKEGLVEVEYNENLEAMFRVSEKGQEFFKLAEARIKFAAITDVHFKRFMRLLTVLGSRRIALNESLQNTNRMIFALTIFVVFNA